MLGRRTVRYNNSDRLVKSRRWDIRLQKTGYIVEAGDCLVVNATMAGRNLILVLLDSTDARSRLADAERIRHWVGGRREPPVHNVSTARQGGLRARIREKIGKLKRHTAARRLAPGDGASWLSHYTAGQPVLATFRRPVKAGLPKPIAASNVQLPVSRLGR